MTTRGLLATCLSILAACSTPRPHNATGETVLSVQGRVAGGPARFGAPELAKLPRRSFVAADPRNGADTTYEGIELQKLLGSELELEKGSDLVVVTGKDGYEVAIPLTVLRQLRPVLADKIGGAPIAEARPEAAPLILAWPNFDSPGLPADPRARWWWVDGVKKVEVRMFLNSYGRALRVPPGAPDEARAGADAFQTSCMMCHRVRGTGGQRGPDLGKRLASPEARAALPETVKKHAHIRGAEPVARTPAAMARSIASFLSVVAISGAGLPQDEPPPEVAPPEKTPRPPGY